MRIAAFICGMVCFCCAVFEFFHLQETNCLKEAKKFSEMLVISGTAAILMLMRAFMPNWVFGWPWG